MHIAVKISAPNDRNGNPRRGWLVYDVREQAGRIGECADSDLVAFVDEGYRGIGALRARFPRAHVLSEVSVSVAEYRAAAKAAA